MACCAKCSRYFSSPRPNAPDLFAVVLAAAACSYAHALPLHVRISPSIHPTRPSSQPAASPHRIFDFCELQPANANSSVIISSACRQCNLRCMAHVPLCAHQIVIYDIRRTCSKRPHQPLSTGAITCIRHAVCAATGTLGTLEMRRRSRINPGRAVRLRLTPADDMAMAGSTDSASLSLIKAHPESARNNNFCNHLLK